MGMGMKMKGIMKITMLVFFYFAFNPWSVIYYYYSPLLQ
jgi:hypothetical protein